jgi:hypothetical protein
MNDILVRLDLSCTRNLPPSIRPHLVIKHKYTTQGTKIEGVKDTKTHSSTSTESQADTMRASSAKRERILTLTSVKSNTSRKRRSVVANNGRGETDLFVTRAGFFPDRTSSVRVPFRSWMRTLACHAHYHTPPFCLVLRSGNPSASFRRATRSEGAKITCFVVSCDTITSLAIYMGPLALLPKKPEILCAKSRGLGQAGSGTCGSAQVLRRPKPLRPSKATTFGPSRAGTPLVQVDGIYFQLVP